MAGSFTVEDATAAEDAWIGVPVDIGAGRYGLEPYPLPEFGRLLAVALNAGGLPDPPVFCDIGAGVGSMVLAAQAAGCRAWGIEAVPEYVLAARQAGADVVLGDADAQDPPFYQAVDVAYVNCPYRNPLAERRFERLIRGWLPPGCVLISVNHAGPPGGWRVILDDPAQWRGVYRKPGRRAGPAGQAR